ncbi:mechanosensitive ion channel family protein [Synoicihabitans lomoniglobus]|uniref:Mechanosensitive ion channel family protein n=1 Tax=Synoicihabitans lomoniglobus TaxID=2909285 RepID=A0AAE9ZZA9_9BACT|nr:mechanosensitive ion channel family protein [Opitutaceae bacterium LMO-M01]WED65543.1 mechanosensitive ion channel family protein [Opitutaceae bacterium LMO-M01]
MTFDQLWNEISTYLPGLMAALPVAAAVILGGMLLNMVLGRMLSLLTKRSHLSPDDVVPARNVIRWIVRIITAILVLGVFGFELGGLWAMISTVLAMVAIGFVAVWSLLSHTSATILLVILRPYSVGDDIELPSENVTGRVIDINFFFTTLLSHDGSQWRVPNNLFFQKVLKRRQSTHQISLAQQLNSPEPARLSAPPAPDPDKPKTEETPASEDFAAKSVPDPATIAPRTTK